jgi:cytochrome c biogenesis protein CcmG, thiol:disulfide interchange protein DsbE
MKLYLKAILITAVVAILLAGLFYKWSQATLPAGVERVTRMDEMEVSGLPDFELPNLDGKQVKLSDFKGQVVIVSFWASWCAPCLDEFPSMIELVDKLKGQVKLIAVSQDSAREEIDAFLKSFPKSKHPDIYILWDEKHTVGRQYDADRLPESFVAGKDLKLVRKIVGSINWATPEAVEFMEALTKK